MALGALQNESDLERFVTGLLDRLGLGPAVKQLQSVVTFGDGAPSVAPKSPRAVYVRFDGGASSTFYVWNGSAWTAVA